MGYENFQYFSLEIYSAWALSTHHQIQTPANSRILSSSHFDSADSLNLIYRILIYKLMLNIKVLFTFVVNWFAGDH